MTWKINCIFFVLVLSACADNDTSNQVKLGKNYLIEISELKSLYNQQDIKIIDFRKNDIYTKEHIKGALNIWRTDIEDTTYPYGGMMASKKQIETLFSKLGIDNSDTIIVYDDIGLCDASRLWWLLQNYNFENVKLLHGGYKGWKEKDGAISNDIPEYKQTQFTLAEKSSMNYHISKNEVLNNLSKKTLLLDTRTVEEFKGIEQKNGAFKAGRLPNSINIDWSTAIDYNGNMNLKPVEALEKLYSTLNVDKNHPIIVYCHSGVRSAHTTFVLTQLLGYNDVKNYDGSWTEWSYFDELPFEKDNIEKLN